jgi:hypothetical protein
MSDHRLTQGSALRYITAVLLAVSAPLAGAQQPLACSLLTIQEMSATAPQVSGKLFADGPLRITAKEVPGLPAAVFVEQCTTEVRTSGAVPVRVSLLTAERALSAQEWKKAEKAVDDPKESGTKGALQVIADAQCFQHSWTNKQTLYEVSCFKTLGHYHVAIGFEHEDRARLPQPARVAELLSKAASRLPRR